MKNPNPATNIDHSDAPEFIPSTRLQQIKYAMRNRQEGKIGWIFLWLIGVPVPLLLVFFLLRGCT